jgi:glycerol-3-phosphate dehydrogenase
MSNESESNPTIPLDEMQRLANKVADRTATPEEEARLPDLIIACMEAHGQVGMYFDAITRVRRHQKAGNPAEANKLKAEFARLFGTDSRPTA